MPIETIQPIEVPSTEPRMTEVVSGIVTDFQKLISQQLALLRAEVRTDWEKTKLAIRPMAVGATLAAVGTMLLGFTLAYCLHWYVSPVGSDPSRFPLWACFGVAALLFVGLGLVLIALGTKAFQSFNPLPDETANALEQNIKAIIDPQAKTVRS